MINQQPTSSNLSNQQDQAIDIWFSSLIDHIKVDHFMLQTKSAPDDKKEFYGALMSNNEGVVLSKMRTMSTQYFIKKLVFEYLQEIKTSKKVPIKLALGITDSKILVWSEIEDDDEQMEDILLLSEAKINSNYSENGFYIHSTIIEKSDNIPVPPHYQTIIE